MSLLKRFVSVSENVGVTSAFIFFNPEKKPKIELLSQKELNIYSKFTSCKRQNEFVAGRIACKKAFFKLISGNADCFEKFPSVSVLNTETGAPFIENSDLFISVSHSHEVAIASVSQQNVGIDIEQINPKRILAMKRMNAECKTEDPHILTVLWTLKESLGKALQTGIVEDFRYYDTKNFCCKNEIYRCNFKNFTSFSGIGMIDEKYAVAIVTLSANFATEQI